MNFILSCKSNNVNTNGGGDGSETKQKLLIKKTVIGKGAYGKVYRGMFEVNTTKKSVAIKQMIYFPHATNGIPLAAVREIAATHHLAGSKYIINLLDYCETMASNIQEKKLVLVYELMACDLTKFLKDRGNPDDCNSRMPMDLIQKWSKQLLLGVQFMHANRIIHRDMKPDNILIDGNEMDIKIADFGLAHAQGFEGTRTPEVVTLWYRSPEIVMRLSYGSSCDLWSVGLIIFEMIKLRPVVVGSAEIELLRNILKLIGKPSDSYLYGLPVSSWECFVKESDLPLVNHIKDQLVDEDPLLVDLIEHLVVFDVENRSTAAEALKLPFFKAEFPISNHSAAALHVKIGPASDDESMSSGTASESDEEEEEEEEEEEDGAEPVELQEVVENLQEVEVKEEPVEQVEIIAEDVSELENSNPNRNGSMAWPRICDEPHSSSFNCRAEVCESAARFRRRTTCYPMSSGDEVRQQGFYGSENGTSQSRAVNPRIVVDPWGSTTDNSMEVDESVTSFDSYKFRVDFNPFQPTDVQSMIDGFGQRNPRVSELWRPDEYGASRVQVREQRAADRRLSMPAAIYPRVSGDPRGAVGGGGGAQRGCDDERRKRRGEEENGGHGG